MNFLPFNFSAFNGADDSPIAPPSTIEAAIASQFIGRHQVGEKVSLEFKTVGSSEFATTGVVVPDTVPGVRIYRQGVNARSTTLPIDTTNLSARGIFKGGFTPGHLDSAGHYYALFTYSVAGEPKAALSFFEVLAGGHRNGSVMSSFYMPQPSGNIFIAHEESGAVAQGLRPYLDTGD